MARFGLTRRRWNLILYVGLILLGVVLAMAVARLVRFEPVGFLVVALLLVIPSWIGRRMLADLFASRMFLAQDKVDQAERAAERAVETLAAQPWRGLFLYTQFGFYTWDALAMALNNLGAARMRRGALEGAEQALAAALDRDPGYGVATYNLGVIQAARGDQAGARALFESAKSQGCSGGPTDRLIAEVSAAYARFATA